VSGIESAARIYAEFLSNGGDQNELKRYVTLDRTILRTIHMIQSGTLSIKAAGFKIAFQRALCRYSLAEQDNLCDNGVDVLVGTQTIRMHLDSGEFTPRLIQQVFTHERVRTIRMHLDSGEFTPRLIQQVFTHERVRTIAEQRQWSEAHPVVDRSRRSAPYLVFDPPGVMINGVFFPQAEIKAWDRQLTNAARRRGK